MDTLFSGTSADADLDAVVLRLEKLAGPSLVGTFGKAIRQSIDEVLDGPRTGRCEFDDLEKTEKTYVGTKIEIVLRTALKLEPGPKLDLEIDGIDVDVKWGMNSGWQIPREAVGQLCLCVGGRKKLSRFQVGVIRCDSANLNLGENQDGKRTISAAGKTAMRMLVVDAPIPPNFLAEVDPALRAHVMAEPTIQRRITRLFQELPYQAIPRGAIATVARTTGDPMRRVRADAAVEDVLGGMRILSASYANPVVKALGHQPLARNEFMSVPVEDLSALPEEAREELPPRVRERFEL